MIDLRGLLAGAGVEITKETPKELWARCPMHFERTGRPDVHPSWSINKHTMQHHCFSCGYDGSLTGVLVDLTGSAPVDLEMEINEQSFHRTMAELYQDPKELLDDVIPQITEWTLMNVLGDVPDRMLNLRWLQRWAIDAYQVRWDRDTKQTVMPVRSPRGEILGAQYRQKGSVYTLPEGMSKSTTLFGYHQAIQSNYCAVVESPLDACRLYQIGVPAVSTLGAFASADQARLLARNFDHVFLALDNPAIDKAGAQGAEILTAQLRHYGIPAIMWDYTGLEDAEGRVAKDVGDVPDDQALIDAWDRTRRFGL